MQPKSNSRDRNVLRVVGEVFSQILNVPVLSGLLVTFLYFKLPVDTPQRMQGWIWSLVFVSLIPLSSLLFYIPFGNPNHEQVVRRQRNASFVVMMISYPLGVWVLHQIHAPSIFRATAVIYSLVTLGLIIFNLLLHYKASGHAAGAAGPVGVMMYLYGLVAVPLLALLPLVTWARLAAKGHSFWQTVVGAVLSLCISVGVMWAYGFQPLMGVIH
ncbi:MAG: hypothetical protein ABFD44_01405 [Anaerolineaceae bacterium]